MTAYRGTENGEQEDRRVGDLHHQPLATPFDRASDKAILCAFASALPDSFHSIMDITSAGALEHVEERIMPWSTMNDWVAEQLKCWLPALSLRPKRVITPVLLSFSFNDHKPVLGNSYCIGMHAL